MKITYDKAVDALSITFAKNWKSAKTKEVAEGINLDFDTKGKLVQIEILNASRFAPAKKLQAVSSPREGLTLAEAAAESELSADTLRSLINKGRLKATKIGRDWKVARVDLVNYLESRDTRGRPSNRELAAAG